MKKIKIKPKSLIQEIKLKTLSVLLVSLLLLSGLLTFTPKKDIREISSAISGSLQGELTSSVNDLFNCGGRDDCDDDVDQSSAYPGPQHKYIAQGYDRFGFPLSWVKYKWTQSDLDDLIKFRESVGGGIGTSIVDESVITSAENDHEIYVEPYADNLQNGEAVVNVLAYTDNESQGKSQSIDVNLFFCLSPWPSITIFPYSDYDSGASPDDPSTNFQTYYCKDRGSIANPDDDYAALKVVERTEADSYMCSGGGGNGLKCNVDYFIAYSSGWTKDSLNNYIGGLPNASSPDSIAINGSNVLVFEGNDWAYYNVSWTSGTLGATDPFASWPDGPTAGIALKPTAIGWNSSEILLIENNSYTKSTDGGLSWSALSTLAEDGWPTDVQIPDEVAIWEDGGDEYLLAMKDNYYRINSQSNSCIDSKCETPNGRVWGSCDASSDCSWGESFSIYDVREYPTTISNWEDNVNFSFKAIGLTDSNILLTSSCERSGGICLLKEFLLISNPACDDEIDNDGDGECDWNGCTINGSALGADSDCADSNDNSESGTCNDGIDNDNDGYIDYPDDFSCDSFGGVEEGDCNDGIDNDNNGFIDYPADANCLSIGDSEGSCNSECCDNIDNNGDGLIDQQNSACDDKADNFETNRCDDGDDNDGDGLIDLVDPGCTNSNDDSELGTAQCDDGIDNDGDGDCDYQNPGDCQDNNIDGECNAEENNCDSMSADAECDNSGDDNESA